jgi:hypothetical protein
MPHEPRGLSEFGGAAYTASGVLFLPGYLLDIVAGAPAPDSVRWRRSPTVRAGYGYLQMPVNGIQAQGR